MLFIITWIIKGLLTTPQLHYLVAEIYHKRVPINLKISEYITHIYCKPMVDALFEFHEVSYNFNFF